MLPSLYNSNFKKIIVKPMIRENFISFGVIFFSINVSIDGTIFGDYVYKNAVLPPSA